MNKALSVGACLAIAILWTTPAGTLFAQEEAEESRWQSEEGRAESQAIVLTRRTNNGAYGTSAFSFRSASQELGEHRNNVDLVFNGCGLLHFNPVGGMNSRVADLGETTLDVELEPADRVWASQAFFPEEGHVYLHQIRHGDQSMVVKFRVDELQRDEMAISWLVVEEVAGRGPTGMSGTMGQCGGHHQAR